jgi:hypothetical protein
MSKKFIPDGDVEFAQMASNFANRLTQDHARYHIPEADAQEIAAAVAEFLEAHKVNQQRHVRSSATALRKEEARAVAERLIRKAGNLIRNDERISSADKVVVRIAERPTKLRKRECPQSRPNLYLVAGKRGWQVMSNRHLIRFTDSERTHSEAKPDGAAALELFADVIPSGAPAPGMPSMRYGAHPMYLRSYSRSPMDVDYPKFAEAVQVVYYARWVSATGETGPFSRPLIVPVDAFATQPALPDHHAGRALPAVEQTVFVTTVRRELPDQTVHAEREMPERLLPADAADAA